MSTGPASPSTVAGRSSRNITTYRQGYLHLRPDTRPTAFHGWEIFRSDDLDHGHFTWQRGGALPCVSWQPVIFHFGGEMKPACENQSLPGLLGFAAPFCPFPNRICWPVDHRTEGSVESEAILVSAVPTNLGSTSVGEMSITGKHLEVL